MKLENDQSCSWINDLTKRTNIKSINSNEDCEWLIIGAGYTGLSAARKLGQLNPNQKIILVDAQLAGEGSSGRNSGYLVDTTLNDGFSSSKDEINYKKKTDSVIQHHVLIPIFSMYYHCLVLWFYLHTYIHNHNLVKGHHEQ